MRKMVDVNIIEDLRKGESLEDTLVKHGTNLKEIFKDINKYSPERVKRTPDSPEWRNIQLTKQNTYRITKTINGHREFYGTYKSFNDAVIVREELIKCNWNIHELPRILERNNIRKQGRRHNTLSQKY